MRKILVPGTLHPLASGVAAILSEEGYEAVQLPPIEEADIDKGLAHVDNDVCVATVAMVGQYLRWFEKHGADDVRWVLSPKICRSCRTVSTPKVLQSAFARAGLHGIEALPFSSPSIKSAAQSPSPLELEAGKPIVGVCGNVPVLTTEQFRRVVCAHLEQSGCQVVMPPLQAIAAQRDFFTPALEWFAENDIRTVIAIMPFGCLGGHAFARGQLRKLQTRFPELQVTILDYDPSASDVNLVNRTELVIQAAREQPRRRYNVCDENIP